VENGLLSALPIYLTMNYAQAASSNNEGSTTGGAPVMEQPEQRQKREEAQAQQEMMRNSILSQVFTYRLIKLAIWLLQLSIFVITYT